MDKITHEVRCEQWSQIINECLSSGLPKTVWLKQNGINEKQFYYWQRVLREKSYQLVKNASPEIVQVIPTRTITEPVAVANSDVLILHIGEMSVEIPETFSEETLRRVIGVLKNA